MRKLYQNSERLLQNQGWATSSLPMRQRIVGSEDAAPPEFAGFCKCTRQKTMVFNNINGYIASTMINDIQNSQG